MYSFGQGNVQGFLNNGLMKNQYESSTMNQSIPGGGAGMGRKTIHLCQLHESVNEQELYQQRSLSLFPPLGQSIALQYQLEGNFHMLPIKLYPSFIPRHTYKKLELTLKAHCRLPQNLRAKTLRVTFKFPAKVQRVFFTNQNNPQEYYSFSDITDMQSLNKVAS
mmetsp:Transcript_14734/g.14340  ORF Transcript_14734/g.14340 Transcript_14734/m.14340 type:complete len:164 (+) Transcript_14734:760-1251(+)